VTRRPLTAKEETLIRLLARSPLPYSSASRRFVQRLRHMLDGDSGRTVTDREAEWLAELAVRYRAAMRRVVAP